MKIAIVKSGGKQYIAQENAKITVDKMVGEVGDAVTFKDVLLVGDTDGKVEVGMPTVKATVTGKITKQFRADKVMTVKFHAKVRYRRRKGHRQPFTEVEVTSIK